ncbi:MAG TPA: hypothetical protein VIJ92_10100 [Ginsengibacter sp.]
MKKVLFILFLEILTTGIICAQSFNINDLIKLSYLPTKEIDRYMYKKGFGLSSTKTDSLSIEASFTTRTKAHIENFASKKNIYISLADNYREYSLQTSMPNEYVDGQRELIKAGFFYDENADVNQDSSILFQKGNIVILASSQKNDTASRYTFELKVKKIPAKIKYAEDLLQFDSHEFLVSFFGEQNVKRDMYYFSEKELKKCSVLFSGTKYQVVFVWGDEKNLDNLLYILVPHVLPTKGAEENNPVTGNSEWQFKNGIYPGMDIKELLRLNQMDFNIYGNASELAFMVKPVENGKIDFKKTAVMLGCNSCDDIKILNQPEISAVALVKKDLPMYVSDVILYPSKE